VYSSRRETEAGLRRETEAGTGATRLVDRPVVATALPSASRAKE
jgi:hypothetical protein